MRHEFARNHLRKVLVRGDKDANRRSNLFIASCLVLWEVYEVRNAKESGRDEMKSVVSRVKFKTKIQYEDRLVVGLWIIV